MNEIVLGEESDEDGRGGFRSHFELYLEAMEECGADTRAIHSFLQSVRKGDEVETALALCGAPPSVCRFVLHTMEIARCGQTHRIAAAFFFGREDVIPDMFRKLVEDLRREFFGVDRLIYYLDRHIEVDGDDHGPRAQAILEKLCGGDPGGKKNLSRPSALRSKHAPLCGMACCATSDGNGWRVRACMPLNRFEGVAKLFP